MLPSLASETMATGLPSSGDNPKLVARLASVGPQTFPRPRSWVSTRAMVPLPDRIGPTITIIFWMSVRPDST